MMTEEKLRILLCEVGKRVYSKGFVAANNGNFSVRISKEKYLITPTGVSKGNMNPEDMVLLFPDGKFVGRKSPSSEYKMHLQIYNNREDIYAVVHAHSPFATAFCVAGLSLEEHVLPEVIVTLGQIPLVKYKTPSSEELAEIVGESAREHDAMLLENHGVVTIGIDLWSAYYSLERVEHAAKIISIARSLGGVQSIPESDLDELFRTFSVLGNKRNC